MSNISAFARLSTVAADVSIVVMTPIGKGITSRNAVLLKNGEQVGKMFTAGSTDEVRNVAAQFYLDTFVDRVHDKRKAPKAWVVNIETGKRDRVNPDDVKALVEAGTHRAGRDVSPEYLNNVKPDDAPHGLKGRRWFHKGSERVRIAPHQVPAYIADGYIDGRGPNTVYPVAATVTTDPTVRCYNI